MARLFAAHHGRYGSPRITAELRAAGWRVSENTVAELMREQGLRARPPRRRRHTTRPGKGRWRVPDLVGRRLAADGLNRRWYSDGTEIATGEGKLHLASVPGLGVGHGRTADRRFRPVRTPRCRAGLRGAGDGGRGSRRPRSDRRGGATHRPGQRGPREYTARSFRTACARCG